MPAKREDIFAALFARLNTATIDGHTPCFRRSSRQMESWADVPSTDTPAFFLIKGNERVTPRMRLPPQWQLEALMFIYCNNNSDAAQVSPSTLLNNVLQAVEDALQLQPTEVATSPDRPTTASQVMGYTWGTTLGGLCHQCQIEGAVEVFEGVQGGTAEAIVPIVVWATGW